MKNDPLLSIGAIANRTGCAVSAIRFYADEGIIPVVRNNAGHRLFHRSTLRRISFVLIMQGMNYSLGEIKSALDALPQERGPTAKDWAEISRLVAVDLDSEIARLTHLKQSLDGCIGCGCLSLSKCQLYNPEDRIAVKGQGARYLLGDRYADLS